MASDTHTRPIRPCLSSSDKKARFFLLLVLTLPVTAAFVAFGSTRWFTPACATSVFWASYIVRLVLTLARPRYLVVPIAMLAMTGIALLPSSISWDAFWPARLMHAKQDSMLLLNAAWWIGMSWILWRAFKSGMRPLSLVRNEPTTNEGILSIRGIAVRIFMLTMLVGLSLLTVNHMILNAAYVTAPHPEETTVAFVGAGTKSIPVRCGSRQRVDYWTLQAEPSAPTWRLYVPDIVSREIVTQRPVRRADLRSRSCILSTP